MLLAGPFIWALLFQRSCFRTVTSVPLFQNSQVGPTIPEQLLGYRCVSPATPGLLLQYHQLGGRRPA